MIKADHCDYLTPELLNCEQCLKYKNRLTEFYYLNMRLCSYMDCFSEGDAKSKIDHLIDYVSNGSAMVLGAFDKENLVGFLWAYEHQFRDEKRVYVSEIHVDELYRGRGIGKSLLSAVESIAKEKGYPALYLHAEGSNDRVVDLYKKEGYVIERVQLRKAL